ncbi:MAG: uracil-DNA glycosylase [Kiritimatiellia bacterium]
MATIAPEAGRLRRELPGIMHPNAKKMLVGIVENLGQVTEYLKESGVSEVESLRRKGEAQSAPSASEAARAEEGSPGAQTALDSIAGEIAKCAGCKLHATRNRTVPGQGNMHPELLFIGEGPGEDEDRQGLAFVGRAGQLLTRLIVRMGFTRDEVFIANIVKCRPPGNRKPLPEEVAACLPFLERQIELLKPAVIVLLGASAFEALFTPGPGKTISKVRGKWIEYRGVPAMPTFHPSYLLRNQSAMWDVWSDMQLVLERLGRTAPPRTGDGKKPA